MTNTKLLSLIMAIVTISNLSACVEPPSKRVQEPIELTGKEVDDGWYPNELSLPQKLRKNSAYGGSAYRKGVTPEGYKYAIYPDGSAVIKLSEARSLNDGWSISCMKDSMTDLRNCEVTSYGAKFYLDYKSSSSPRSICIMGHDFPRRRGMIRVDSLKPLKTNYNGCIPGKYSKLLATGEMVAIRRYKWPNDWAADYTNSISGLKSAMSLVTFIRKNIDNLEFEDGSR